MRLSKKLELFINILGYSTSNRKLQKSFEYFDLTINFYFNKF